MAQGNAITRTRRCWRKWHTRPVSILPVKLALVVHRAECSECALRLLATTLPWATLCACHVRRAYYKDELFVPASPAELEEKGGRGRGEEEADVVAGLADTRAALSTERILGFLWPLVHEHALQPAGIDRVVQDKERDQTPLRRFSTSQTRSRGSLRLTSRADAPPLRQSESPPRTRVTPPPRVLL